MSQYLLIETGLRSSSTRSSFTVHVYRTTPSDFRPKVSDLNLAFKSHWAGVLRSTSNFTSLIPLAAKLSEYRLYLASSGRDDPNLGFESNWKTLSEFNDDELEELITGCMREKRQLRTCLMTRCEVRLLGEEWEREVERREEGRRRHEELIGLLRRLLPSEEAEGMAAVGTPIPASIPEVLQQPPAYNT